MAEVTRIRLASNSPRRRELMALGSWIVTSSVPAVDESRLAGEAPADYVIRLARSKAVAARVGAQPGEVIVAADTAVVDGASVLGKPADPAEAADMLRRLRGRTHAVYTGLALLHIDSRQVHTDICVTAVPMRDYDDAEIDAYVASGDPMDKAGAYGIQHEGFHPVRTMAGCYASVMGMPLCHVQRLLARVSSDLPPGLPESCQQHLRYACPVSSAILRGEPVG